MRQHRASEKRIVLFLVFLLIITSLSGCASTEVLLPYKKAPVVEKPEEEEEKEEPEVVVSAPEPEPVPEEPAAPEEPEPEPEPAPEPPKPIVFTPGVVDGFNYTNETLAFGMTLDENWTYMTQEDLNQINGFKDEVNTENVTAYLEEPQEYVDVDVVSGGIGNEIVISAIKELYIGTDDLAQVAADDTEGVIEQFKKAKYENIESEIVEVNFLGEPLSAGKVTCINEGNQYTSLRIHGIKNGYFYTIMFLYFGEDISNKLIGYFYSLEEEGEPV